MRALTLLVLVALIATACGRAGTPRPTARSTARPPAAVATTASPPTAARPLFLTASLTDVRTGAPFTIGGFPGKVVLVIAMAVW
jgi:hypothetical protein